MLFLIELKKLIMTSSLLLSAMTIVAITGTALVTLKYNAYHEDDIDIILYNDSDEIDSYTDYKYSPKFNYNLNQLSHDKPIVKRSSNEEFVPRPQYVYSDKNLSMIDETKREKIKEV